ncbi:hypothetical protein B5P44_29700 [Mycobacterium sp. CBMA 213]|nr:hypothetical protein [Mycolicibacterium sp. CBMA 213]
MIVGDGATAGTDVVWVCVDVGDAEDADDEGAVVSAGVTLSPPLTDNATPTAATPATAPARAITTAGTLYQGFG